MDSAVIQLEMLDEAARSFYRMALKTLSEAEVPFLLGGAFAFACYTGIERDTKDLDLFVRERDLKRALDAFAAAGCRTEVPFPHWLGKAHCGDFFVDVIFSSGNGVATVDDAWFEHATYGEVLGVPVGVIPAEELLWSKAFVQERERYDGADVAHLLRARAEELNWPRLLERFGANWRVLLAHLTLFGFVYPGEAGRLPAWALAELTGRLQAETASPPSVQGKPCRGTLISREQYLVDVEQWGYRDARIQPEGSMSAREIGLWTADIGE